MTHPTLIFIHGLNASHLSFAYLLDKIDTDLPYQLIDYRSHQPLKQSIADVISALPKGPLILVGHSLGGVIAMNIAIQGAHDINRVITISSPLGGSKSAAFLQFFARQMDVVADITPHSTFIKSLQGKAPCPVLSIISTAGHLPVSQEPNDGVVAIESQNALSSAKKIAISANHFEVLAHEKTVEAVSKFIKVK